MRPTAVQTALWSSRFNSPVPGPAEVKIRLRARGVSYTDVLRIAGQYHVKTEPPFVPGSEAAGEILQLGPDVKGLKVGDRVVCGGGFAEETVQAAGSVIKLPDTVAFEAAAAFRSNYMTAYYALQRGRLRAGETLLVHGAAGGVGLATVDMGKLMGARVIATARNPERLEVCKQLGADDVIDCSSSELIEEVYHPIAAAVSVLGVKGVAHLQVHLFPSVDAVPLDEISGMFRPRDDVMREILERWRHRPVDQETIREGGAP